MRDYTMWTSRTCSNKMTPGARGRSAQNMLLHLDVLMGCTNLSHGQCATTTVDNMQSGCHRSILQHITHEDGLQNTSKWKQYQDENISEVVRIPMFVDGLPSETDLDKDPKLYTTWQVVLAFNRPDHSMNGQGIQSMRVPLNISVIVHTKYRLNRRIAMQW